MKNNKGITLIALVITIIVLLILAGVSIAMLTGDNGILTKATESTKATDLAEVLERVNMELDAQMTNAMAGDAFDDETTIKSNVGTLPEGYEIAVTTGSGSYSTSDSVTITVSAKSGSNVLEPGQPLGEVKYEGGKWVVKPITKDAPDDAS